MFFIFKYYFSQILHHLLMFMIFKVIIARLDFFYIHRTFAMISLLRVSASRSENAAAAKSKIAASKLAAVTTVVSGGVGTNNSKGVSPLLESAAPLLIEPNDVVEEKAIL